MKVDLSARSLIPDVHEIIAVCGMNDRIENSKQGHGVLKDMAREAGTCGIV